MTYSIAVIVSTAISILAVSPLPPHAPAGHAYYPMNAGDVWVYESTARGEFRNEVVDASPLEGGMRYRVRSTDASGRVQYVRVRIETDRVFASPGSSPEQLLVDFGVPLKASFETTQGTAPMRIEYRALHETLTLPGGSYRDVREYRHVPASGPEYSSYYARGLGLVAMVWPEPGPHVRLLQATVAGEAFKPSSK